MNLSKPFLCGILFFAFVFSAAAQQKNDDENKIPPQLKPAVEKRYRINPGDVLEIIYRYTPEFNQTVTVQPDGFVVLQIVGGLELKGLTVEEARQKILENAVKRLKDPEITLLLKEFQKPYFVVAGEVVQPGKFQMNENVTALQAVLLAGGFKDSAKSSQILVFRRINSDTAEVKLLNLKGIKKTSDLENDFELESGDMIFVPQNTITKVERYIKFVNLASIFQLF
jgi:polysaccharide biosynthesis/export protein